MLIKGLCDYYNILKERGDVLPEGYSPVSIKYKISMLDCIMQFTKQISSSVGV